MDKQSFSSIQATTNTSRYAAAVFHKGRTWFCRWAFGHRRVLWTQNVAADAGSDRPSLSTGELHITPLTGILQMRPSFSYLDKADNKSREREAANEGGLEISPLNPESNITHHRRDPGHLEAAFVCYGGRW